jgi:hypothetical protein
MDEAPQVAQDIQVEEEREDQGIFYALYGIE